ncbi:cytochrome c oxidase subunit 2 [Capsicum baccatum]|uniref:Cytochrome c oxidase subunit 2 n=1 Tax=Capsicum baccatum TaxID=33114 RepID=A0A2G2VEB5_CAPBA|nr:cytochrome c oxidase subunit 2 [Capsicum baccatum]
MFSKPVAFLLEFSAILFSTILAIMLEIKLFRWCFLLYNYLLSELELEIHQDFVCLLILLLVFVSWILGRTLWHFHYKKNPDISRVPIMESVWTLSLFLSFSFFFSELLLETVDCTGKNSGGGASTSSPKPDEWEMALDLPDNQAAPECLRSHITEKKS